MTWRLPGIVATALVLATCSGPEEPSAAFAGIYDLLSVDSMPLPVQLKTPDGVPYIEILGAVLTFDADGGMTLVSTHRRLDGGNPEAQADTLEGEYTVDGNDILVSAPGASPMRFTRTDNRLSTTADGHTIVYARRN